MHSPFCVFSFARTPHFTLPTLHRSSWRYLRKCNIKGKRPFYGGNVLFREMIYVCLPHVGGQLACASSIQGKRKSHGTQHAASATTPNSLTVTCNPAALYVSARPIVALVGNIGSLHFIYIRQASSPPAAFVIPVVPTGPNVFYIVQNIL